uniref:Putative 3-ketoacyl-CoA thiolase n=1 Tax=Euglena gracilis TaxID=3039 RepID=A0A0F7R3L7_EUGGR|nr:putative 3-ketoacyl-CoA thiolase [Euglena gracilis]
MKGLRSVVIVSACRTPIGAFGGSLKDMATPQLAAVVMRGALQKANVAPSLVEDVRFGCCFPDISAANVARIGALLAGIPDTVPAGTENRVCTSGMSCLHGATTAIGAGYQDVVLIGGVENMSQQPYVLPTVRWGTRLQDGPCIDALTQQLHAGSHHVPYPLNGKMTALRGKPYIMGMTAEILAQEHHLSREEQDAVALRSHKNAERANADGTFAAEIVPITVKQKKKAKEVAHDEHFRKDVTAEELSALPTAFLPQPKGGTVTAGNASGIGDGASAILLMSRDKAQQLGIRPLATVTGMATGGCAPEIMGYSPVAAVSNLLRQRGTTIADYDLVELHEAFAAQYLACEKALGLIRERTNVNGSGIGLAHPVGSSGSRILVTLLHEMVRRRSQRGLAAICGGGGISLATELTLD